jgi:ABC-type nitrate/sulfonate/bicarbonate transport system substrate-binding protein
MKRSLIHYIVHTILLVVLALQTQATANAAERVRLGWQTPWATQGQLVMALKHSNIPELAGSDLDYLGFAYGGPLNQAALAKGVDVLLTADQPAIALIARKSGFKIVARMMYNRTCLYVPPASPVKTLTDLKGATISGPVGAAAERNALDALKEAGLEPATLKMGKLDMEQQVALLRGGAKDGKWGAIDALYGFDPLPAAFEAEGLARMVKCGNVVSMVLASPEMLGARRAELEKFLTAFQLAWWLYANKPDELNALFLKESGLEIPVAALETSAAVEPNRFEKQLDKQRLTFTDDDFKVIDRAASFLQSIGVLKAPIDARAPDTIDLKPLEAVLASGRAAALTGKIALK